IFVPQDYLIAQGIGKLMPGQLPHTAIKYSFSQDGVKWIDLDALSEEMTGKAVKVTGMLSGEPAKTYTIQEPGAPPAAEGELHAVLTGVSGEDHTQAFEQTGFCMQEAAEGEGAAPGSQISELQRLRSIVDAISEDTTVYPKYSIRVDASGKMVMNDVFSGVPYPDKLESFVHSM
ncbi:Radial spoke head protein 9, partial [Xylographa vitiligo]|nr:Radial spoke head protein 9 [Xylographa vitiligo]